MCSHMYHFLLNVLDIKIHFFMTVMLFYRYGTFFNIITKASSMSKSINTWKTLNPSNFTGQGNISFHNKTFFLFQCESKRGHVCFGCRKKLKTTKFNMFVLRHFENYSFYNVNTHSEWGKNEDKYYHANKACV